MTPHKQLFHHDPPHSYGDCGRTVYACLLDRPPESVPHWFQMGIIDDEIAAQKAWFEEQGLVEYQVVYPGAEPLENVLLSVAHFNAGEYYILMGTSRTGVNHVVICKDTEIVHDPSRSDAGIVGPGNDGFWRVFFLARKL